MLDLNNGTQAPDIYPYSDDLYLSKPWGAPLSLNSLDQMTQSASILKGFRSVQVFIPKGLAVDPTDLPEDSRLFRFVFVSVRSLVDGLIKNEGVWLDRQSLTVVFELTRRLLKQA
jgi:hypothetical protein